MLPKAISGPNTISICMTLLNLVGLRTGVVFLGVFLVVAKSPVSSMGSAGNESKDIVFYIIFCISNPRWKRL